MDPTSPNRQSQQPHFKQSSCQYKSKAFSKNRSVIRLQQPAHSRNPIAEPLSLPPPPPLTPLILFNKDVFCVATATTAFVTPVALHVADAAFDEDDIGAVSDVETDEMATADAANVPGDAIVAEDATTPDDTVAAAVDCVNNGSCCDDGGGMAVE